MGTIYSGKRGLILDRRWSDRKRLPLRATLEVPNHTEPVEAELRDISLGGAFVETRFLLPYYPLVIRFKLPGSLQDFHLETKVVYRTPSGAGLMFMRTSTSEIRALSEMLSRIPAPVSAPASNS